MEEIKPGYTRVSSLLDLMPSVEVLSDGKNKFKYILQEIDPAVLANKANIGKNIHEAIEEHFKGGGFFPLSDEEQGYYQSFLQIEKVVRFDPYVVEKRFDCDNLKITGKVDLVNKTSKGLMLVDFKTSAVADPKKWALQAAFYCYLCNINKIDLIDQALFIKLDKEGKKPKTISFNIDTNLRATMVSLLNLYRYLLT